MNTTKIDELDKLENSLRTAKALSDLLTCSEVTELNPETINEVGVQLSSLIDQSKKSLRILLDMK